MTTVDRVGTEKEKRKNTQHIVRSTMLLFVMFGVSKVISLVQTFIIARAFGISDAWDAYIAAARIPDAIVLLMGGGALSFAFIPVFSGLLAKGNTERAWKLASHVVNTIFVAAFLASVFAFIFTPFLINNVIAPAYPDATAELSISLMRILLIGSLIFSVSGMVMGILHSHNHFLLPALAPILNDVGILFGVIFLLDRFGVYGMVYGSILGALMHLLIQVPGLIHFNARWHLELGWDDPLLWQVIRLMLPRLAGLGVSNINIIIMTNFGSRLGEGATSAIDWGWRIMQIPQTLLGTAMGIVIFPTLSALSEVQDEIGKRGAMSGALRFIMIATIPSAIGLILVGYPLLSLLEGGQFDSSATGIVYGALRAFTLGIVVHSMLEIVARSFYADKDTVTPLLAAIVGAGINIVLAYFLTGIATGTASVDKVWGIAAANSIGVAVEVSILLVILRQRWHGIQEGTIAMTTAKTLVASLIMGLAVLAVEFGFNTLGLHGRLLYTVAQVGTQIAVGGIVFLIATLLLRMQEVRDLLKLIFRRGQDVELESVQPVS